MQRVVLSGDNIYTRESSKTRGAKKRCAGETTWPAFGVCILRFGSGGHGESANQRVLIQQPCGHCGAPPAMATAAGSGSPLDNSKVLTSPSIFDARVVVGGTTYLIQLYLNSCHAFLGP